MQCEASQQYAEVIAYCTVNCVYIWSPKIASSIASLEKPLHDRVSCSLHKLEIDTAVAKTTIGYIISHDSVCFDRYMRFRVDAAQA